MGTGEQGLLELVLLFLIASIFMAVIIFGLSLTRLHTRRKFDKFEAGLKWLREKNKGHVEQFRIGPNQLRLATNKEWYLFEIDEGRAISTKDKKLLENIKTCLLKKNIKVPYL